MSSRRSFFKRAIVAAAGVTALPNVTKITETKKVIQPVNEVFAATYNPREAWFTAPTITGRPIGAFKPWNDEEEDEEY